MPKIALDENYKTIESVPLTQRKSENLDLSMKSRRCHGCDDSRDEGNLQIKNIISSCDDLKRETTLDKRTLDSSLTRVQNFFEEYDKYVQFKTESSDIVEDLS